MLTQDASAPGDPELHTHFLIPNAVFCDSGRVGSLDTAAIGGFIFEADAFYQPRLAQNSATPASSPSSITRQVPR